MALVALAAAALVAFTPLLRELQRSLLDLQAGALAREAPAESVLVIDIDDASLAAARPLLGEWPWARDVHALAIEQLRAAGARAIAIDLLFVGPAAGDDALARAQARPGAPVWLAAAGLGSTSDLAAAGPPADGAPHEARPFRWPELALPTPSVHPATGALRLGVVTTPLDADGVLRALPLWHADARRRLPVMPWAIALKTRPDAPPPRLDADGRLRLALPRPQALPRVLPFARLLAAASDPEAADVLRRQVQGRTVFIGSSALLGDRVLTPRGQLSGAVVLAQAHADLVDGLVPRPRSAWLESALVLVALAPALLAARRVRSAPRQAVRDVALAATAVLGALSVVLATVHQPSDPLPALAALAASLAMLLARHAREQTLARRRLAREAAIHEATLQAKARFLSNVSHEIRTPLNALLGVAEVLARTELSPVQRRHVQVFDESGRLLLALVNDLLDLSKMEAGHFELQPEPFELHALLERVAELMRPRAEAKGLRFELETAPALPRAVLGDRMRLEQALANLLANAIKFTARGGVWLRVHAEPDDAERVAFEVEDSGIGIAPSKLETIFEPFAQADGSITRSFGGTGLGLAITRNLARAMGGSVVVRSTPGQGSIFTLRARLPAAQRPPARAPQPPWSGPALRHRVLLAEDNEVNVYVFRAMLEHEALELEVVRDGAAALATLRRRRYGIVFLDVHMPLMDGLSVTRELRALEAATGRARTPVVALTADAFASDVQQALEAGCDRHVAKPFGREQLLAAIRELALADDAHGDEPALDPGREEECSRSRPGGSVMPGREVAGSEAPDPLAGRAAALERIGDPATYEQLVAHARVFFAHWPASWGEAQQADGAPQALRLAHDLKSTAAAVGADTLAAAATALEAALRCDDTAAAAAALESARRALPPVLLALATPEQTSR